MTQAANLAALGTNAGTTGILPAAGGGTAGTAGVTGFKNRIINGNFAIDQRNAGAAVTPSASYAFCLDRWSYGLSQSSKLTFQQSTTAPVGFYNSLKVTVASAFSPGSSDRFILYQPIEGVNVYDLAWGTANAKSIAISFQVYSSITGTFSAALSNSAGTQSYAFSYSISAANTWTTITAVVPGSTTGSWNLGTTSAAIYLYFNLGDGSSFLGAANTWSSSFIEGVTGQTSLVANAGATWYVTGCQLEVGSAATNFDVRSYGTELGLCQRYFWKIINPSLKGCASSTTGINRCGCPFPVPMRASPSVSYTATIWWYDGVISGTLATMTSAYSNTGFFEIDGTVGTNNTAAGRPIVIYIDSSYTGYFSISAEL